MSDPFEEYLGLYDPVDKFMAVYVALIVVYMLGRSLFRQRGPSMRDYGQREALLLTEPALQHLERGGTYSTRRWHGGDLTLHAAPQRVPDLEDADEPNGEDTDADT